MNYTKQGPFVEDAAPPVGPAQLNAFDDGLADAHADQEYGTRAARPAASTAKKNHIYWAYDTGERFLCDGTTWQPLTVGTAGLQDGAVTPAKLATATTQQWRDILTVTGEIGVGHVVVTEYAVTIGNNMNLFTYGSAGSARAAFMVNPDHYALAGKSVYFRVLRTTITNGVALAFGISGYMRNVSVGAGGSSAPAVTASTLRASIGGGIAYGTNNHYEEHSGDFQLPAGDWYYTFGLSYNTGPVPAGFAADVVLRLQTRTY